MAVHIDLNAHTVTAAVRDLVARPSRRRASGLWQQMRARLGNQVHEQYAQWCAVHAPTVNTEIAVDLRRCVDGFAVHIRGRVDGVDDSCQDQVVIEEVKSMLDYTDQLRTTNAELYPAYCRQLHLYGLALADRWPTRAITLRLVLGSIIDKGWHRLDVAFNPALADAKLGATIRGLIRQQRHAHKRAQDRARAAAALTFPYPTPRRGQRELMNTIDRGLAQQLPIVAMAPTGTGKTVSALLPAMRTALRANASVYFATSKTTQQALVASTFTAIVASAKTTPHRLCAITMRAKARMCPPGDLACQADLCDYLHGFDYRSAACVDELLANAGHLSADRIYAVGEQHRLCPFELSLAVSARADVIIGDYNYVFDRAATTPLRSIVVIDEAHNLFDRARGYNSPFLARNELLTLPPMLAGLARQALAAVDATLPSTQAAGGRRRVELDRVTWDALADVAETGLLRYVIYKRARREVKPHDPVSATLRTILHIRHLLCRADSALIAFASGTSGPGGSGVGIMCVDPSTHLAECHRSALGTVAISATLSPQDYYCDVLGFAKLDPVRVRVPSPFPSSNRCVVVVPTIETTYRRRTSQLGSIADTISRIVHTRPGNYAAYFPSFALLSAVANHLHLDPASVLTQQAGMSRDRRSAVIAQIRQTKTPLLLLAVMGGVFSEGIDLPGDALIGAIVVGPGLPQLGFERQTMREHFDRTRGDGFSYAVLYPGMQRVVQSAGRVIRTMTDRGIIALLGQRFTQPPYSNCLPAEWHGGDITTLISADPASRISAFWSAKGETGREQ